MDDRVAFFGLAVQNRRKELELSQVELAEKAKLSSSYVSRVERGLTPPALDTICALADALRVRPSALMREAERMSA
ncbi:helix-turn-helix domain-containing protein [Variovorax sp. J22R115]|uniref:helix-turn-helix domain-containing protein n=1 Tax=Variovorax sp. J22R115 TaxID=3053509 RepID=UPI00257824B0|nr:helix-turn-helix transcriptional regulator [Variovorax sp. J22R115]MDM0053820.1 helix-turn-helix transcriptional regulator [Variovorax sp. J22R115]